jgi:hypothetical protein
MFQNNRLLYTSALITLCFVPLAIIDAQTEGAVRMVGIPFEPAGNQDINVFIRALYLLAIGVGAALAVLRLILAGAKYILSDLVTSKESAKKDIRSSIIGLVVILAAVLILNTINPQLTTLNALNLADVTAPIFNYVPNTQEGTQIEYTGVDFVGPDSCGAGEILQQSQSADGRTITRSCVPAANTDVDIPTQDDVAPGETLRQEEISVPCAGLCSFADGSDNLVGRSSAQGECDRLSGGRGEFIQTSVTQGICSWSN